MKILSLTLAIICLVMIAWEDFADRRVRWGYFPLLAAAGLMYSLDRLHSPVRLAMYTGCNLGFLVVQFLLLKAWFFLRQKAMRAIIDRKIGWGDILFLLAAAFFFSPVNFIAFYLYSLTLVLVLSLLWGAYRRSALRSIPLAGLQSVFLLLFIGAGTYLHSSLVDDQWLMDKIIRP